MQTETVWLDGIEGIFTKTDNFYPLPKGGSDTSTAVESFLRDAQGQDETLDTDDYEDDDDTDDDDLDDDDLDDDLDDDDDVESFADQFLEDVAPEHQEIVNQYLKQWDAGVTKKFQKLQSQIQAYNEFGDPDEIGQALQAVEFMRENPQELYEMLKEEFEGDQGQGTPRADQNPAFQGLPEEFVGEFGQLKSVVELLADHFLQNQEQTRQQQEDQAVEELVTELREQHGDFDEDYVLSKIANGMKPERAIKQFKRLEQKAMERALEGQGPDFPVLGSGGSIPQDQQPQKLGDLGRKQVQNFVKDVLAQAADRS